MDAKERINASSVDDRLSGIRDLVAAVNGIKALAPEDQVSTLTGARRTVDELRERVEHARAEYEDAHAWLKVLEGVAMGGRDVSTGASAPVPPPLPAEPPVVAPEPDISPKRTDRTVASVPVADARRRDDK
jgi:hypothetical protein